MEEQELQELYEELINKKVPPIHQHFYLRDMELLRGASDDGLLESYRNVKRLIALQCEDPLTYNQLNPMSRGDMDITSDGHRLAGKKKQILFEIIRRDLTDKNS